MSKKPNIIYFFSDQHRCVAYALIKFTKFNDMSEGIVQKIKNTVFQHFLDMPLCKVVNSDLQLCWKQQISCWAQRNGNLVLLTLSKSFNYLTVARR